MQDSPSKSLLSPDFIFHLNQYYQKPFKWTVFSKDALTNQRISSGKWHKKMHEHLLKYASSAWKKSMERNPYYRELVKSHDLTDKRTKSLNKVAQDIFQNEKLKEKQDGINRVRSQLNKIGGNKYRIQSPYIKPNIKKNIIEVIEPEIKKIKISKKNFIQSRLMKIGNNFKNFNDGEISKDNYEICSERINYVINDCQEFLEKKSDSFLKLNKDLMQVRKSLNNVAKNLDSFRENVIFNGYLEGNELLEAGKEKEKEDLEIQKEVGIWLKEGKGRIKKEEIMKIDQELNCMKHFDRKNKFKKAVQDLKRLK